MAVFITITFLILLLLFIFMLAPRASYHQALAKMAKNRSLDSRDYSDLQNCFKKNADIEEIKDGTTPLMKAISFVFIDLLTREVAADLIKKGANPNHHGDSISPLMVACSPRTIISSVLKGTGGSVRVNCSEATYQKGRWLIELLVKSGADMNWKNTSGQTALHIAAAEGNLLAIKTLLKFDANPNIKNAHGQTALDILEETQNNPQIIRSNSLPNSPVNIIPDLEQNPVYKLLIEKT